VSTIAARSFRSVPVRHPEWWWYAVAAAAGFVLVAEALGPDHHAAPAGFAGSVGSGLDHWFLMVLAMMVPMAAPQARGVAVRSLWARRHRAAAFFMVGHVAVWLLVGVVVVVGVTALETWRGPTEPAPWVVPALLVLAALWQVSPPRRRAMRRCGSVRLHAADGVAADVDCARAGVRAGALCVVSCGAVMLPMAVYPGAMHSLPLMAAVLAILLWERAAGPNPATRPGRPHEALALLVLAAVVAAVTAGTLAHAPPLA